MAPKLDKIMDEECSKVMKSTDARWSEDKIHGEQEVDLDSTEDVVKSTITLLVGVLGMLLLRYSESVGPKYSEYNKDLVAFRQERGRSLLQQLQIFLGFLPDRGCRYLQQVKNPVKVRTATTFSEGPLHQSQQGAQELPPSEEIPTIPKAEAKPTRKEQNFRGCKAAKMSRPRGKVPIVYARFYNNI